MFKLNKTTIVILTSAMSVNAFAYEAFEGVEVGAYGSSSYQKADLSGEEMFNNTANVYLDATIKDYFKVAIDGNYSHYEDMIEGSDLEALTKFDLYQGYVGFENKSFGLKAGRFADYHLKGQNALDTHSALITYDLGVGGDFIQSQHSIIDGASISYSFPLNGGSFTGSIYGGKNTQSLYPEVSISGTKYGAQFLTEKGGHSFILGAYVQELDELKIDAEDFHANSKIDFAKMTNFYSSYKYENDIMFVDTSILFGQIENKGQAVTRDDGGTGIPTPPGEGDDGDTGEDKEPLNKAFDRTLIDLKAGVKFSGFKPYIGYALYEDDLRNETTTMTYGVRYDYKGIGALIKYDDIETLSGTETLEEEYVSAEIFFRF